MKQYEYKIIIIPVEDFGTQLRKFGLEGWELVSSIREQISASLHEWITENKQYNIYFNCIFKREMVK